MHTKSVVMAALLAICSFDTATAQPASLSLMTYNVKGLPWPVASDRPAALDAIARQLAALRLQGRQPNLVALQEAFVPEAKAIGRAAGYRYVVVGPSRYRAAASAGSASDRAFTASDSLLLGEGMGKRVDSGLAIFSDYPIVAVRRMAYEICAGFDCLANKGALAVRIAVPGFATPLTLVNSHLNSGLASGAPRPRSTYAFRRQLDDLKAFISDVAVTGSPMLVAGDLNVGNRNDRRDYFTASFLDGTMGFAAAEHDCGRDLRCEGGSPGGVSESIRRGRDWLLYRSSPRLTLRPIELAAPFGRSSDGSMLSDHVGITATYSLDARPLADPRRLQIASR